jgi:sugar lactone lactonase YvrE
VENTWLHLSPANQNGTGSTNVVFSFDANPGATRTGAIAVGGQTLTVTQAGETYVAATPLTMLGSQPSGMFQPEGVAVDTAGNVYIADSGNNAIKEWVNAYNTNITLVGSGLASPAGVALDNAGNVYIADAGDNAVKEWNVANSNLTTVVSMGPVSPAGIALDSYGNIYIADPADAAIREWVAATASLTTLVSSGLDLPESVAVDRAGNLYIADTGSSAIKVWNPANGSLTTLAGSGLKSPYGVAVDGAGNVFIADTSDAAIKKWTAATGNLTTLVPSGLSSPFGLAVDSTGNLFATDSTGNALLELPRAYVDPSARMESPVGGNDALPTVLPSAENLLAPFMPVSDQSWLQISSISNGVVGLSLAPNGGTSRAANITLLGQTVPVLQSAPIYTLGTTTLLEGSGGGSNCVVLAVLPAGAAWTNTANAGWLHLGPALQSGTGCTNVVFGCDPNPGSTRSGTLTVGGQTLTVTQAGSTYVAATPLGTLVSTGLNAPAGVVVDAAGDVSAVAQGYGGTSRAAPSRLIAPKRPPINRRSIPRRVAIRLPWPARTFLD